MPAMNETLWGSNESASIYIKDPSPEVDAAWDHIAADAGPIITISSDEARRLGRDPATIVKAPHDWGFGNDAYPAQIDVFHEIHCLNMLRKEMVSASNKPPPNLNIAVLGSLLSTDVWRSWERTLFAYPTQKALLAHRSAHAHVQCRCGYRHA
jgi:hypothetical protein